MIKSVGLRLNNFEILLYRKFQRGRREIGKGWKGE